MEKLSNIKYTILNKEFKYKDKTLFWGSEKHSLKNKRTKKYIIELVNFLFYRKKFKGKDSEILKDVKVIKHRNKPNTFPKYSAKDKLEIKAYKAVNPKLIEIIWTKKYGWKYNFENVGHKIQWIDEDMIQKIGDR